MWERESEPLERVHLKSIRWCEWLVWERFKRAWGRESNSIQIERTRVWKFGGGAQLFFQHGVWVYSSFIITAANFKVIECRKNWLFRGQFLLQIVCCLLLSEVVHNDWSIIMYKTSTYWHLFLLTHNGYFFPSWQRHQYWDIVCTVLAMWVCVAGFA